jgi:hypothetical protein
MNVVRCAIAGAALFVAAGCGKDHTPTVPAPRAPSAAQRDAGVAADAARQVPAAGHYDAVVDFSTLALTPRGSNCLLQVSGKLVFTGTIQGTAIGHTSALVFAPCAKVATTSPGTFRDVYTSKAVFDGSVNGETAHAKLLYAGQTNVGGAIDAHLIFSDGEAGVLDAVNARVAVGGDYRGAVVAH